MQYAFQAEVNPTTLATDCVIVGVYADKILSQAAALLDETSENALQQHLALADFTGERNTSSLLYKVKNITSPRVLLVGLGDQAKFNLESLNQATRTTANVLKKANLTQVSSFLVQELATEQQAAAIRQSLLTLGDVFYTFNVYKSKPETAPTLTQWTLAQTNQGEGEAALQQGLAIQRGAYLARDLGNAPGNVCTPTYLAKTAQSLADRHSQVQITVLEESDMEALGMGSFMSVSKGSEQPGKMIVLNYQGAGAELAPIVLVGKGITFDTGGISLKPGLAMDEMKYDMGGAASVLGSFQACVEMRLPLNVVMIIAAAENMPSGRASKPGDIVTSMSGKTIEILNTDAEGRLVLCDALTYAERFKPAAVVDVATLTGACITALGHHTAGLLSNNDALAAELWSAGQQADDEVWRLPMNDKYQEQLKSNFADMANIGGPAGGTITAACFLARFTESYPWAHLDIAGVAWKSGAAKGSTGRPVPLLTQWLLNRAQVA
ncbi:leucyl aminopeptidase [Thiofilum flexile]|uniref:leucyl aminopeptidase n=1 Tax=Thiofilum flexile TaxID=125627 RepID=UPI00036BBC76|nr:leucyl aminopeptidase [Thiofilum flexile]